MDNILYAVVGVYLLIINIAAIAVYGIDKRKAVHQKMRISEKTLIILALAGGSIGAIIAMIVFHHKTKKPKFYIGVPAILILQVCLAGGLFFLPWFTN